MKGRMTTSSFGVWCVAGQGFFVCLLPCFFMLLGKAFQIQNRDTRRETARHPSFSRLYAIQKLKSMLFLTNLIQLAKSIRYFEIFSVKQNFDVPIKLNVRFLSSPIQEIFILVLKFKMGIITTLLVSDVSINFGTELICSS